MSWLDEKKDRGLHPPKDEENGVLDSLRLRWGEEKSKRIIEAAEKAWETSQKIMGRDRFAVNDITSRMLLPEAEHFTLPNGQPAVRFKPPARYTFGIDLGVPMLDQTKMFILGSPGEDPEIRIKVRKHKLKFNFNN